MDFVSPENVDECIKLTGEFRRLPPGHRSKEDKLEVGMLYFSYLVSVYDVLYDMMADLDFNLVCSG